MPDEVRGGLYNRMRLPIALCLVVMLGGIYFSINSRGTFHFYEVEDFVNYQMLAEAFLSGQLSLKLQIDPERLKHDRPADPFLPYPILLDTIVFAGKAYFLQEPLPALIRAALMGFLSLSVPTGAVVVFAGLGSFLWIGLILFTLSSRFLPQAPKWLIWLVWTAFGLSGTQLYMISRPVVYHEAIVWGGFFALGGAAVITRALAADRLQWTTLLASGLLFGAAIACRGPFLFYSASFFAVLAVYVFGKNRDIGSVLKYLFAFSAPVGLFVAILLLYNYLRFGNMLEFGNRHLCTLDVFYEYCCINDGFFRLAHVPYNLYDWFLRTPVYQSRFPFIEFPYVGVTHGNVLNVTEKVTSLLFMVPILIAVAAAPHAIRRKREESPLIAILAGYALSSISTFCFLNFYVLSAARYLYEFTPLLFPILFVTLSRLWEFSAGQKRQRILFHLSVGLLFVLTVVYGFALGFNGMLQW